MLLYSGSERRVRLGGANPDETTNNRMELLGAISALKAIEPGPSILMHGDSQYVVYGMSEWLPVWKQRNWLKRDRKPVLNRDLWEELERAAGRHRQVVWTWVRGHAGDELNEESDRLANYYATLAGRNDPAATAGPARL